MSVGWDGQRLRSVVFEVRHKCDIRLRLSTGDLNTMSHTVLTSLVESPGKGESHDKSPRVRQEDPVIPTTL